MQSRRLWGVGLYAVAMAYVESAVVIYLRRLYGVSDLMRDVPPFDPMIAAIELGRELATLVMLLAVGWIAGRTRQARTGFALFAFGLWDIFYYVWLKLSINWPASLLTPDVLFLVPLPWWGPVLSPVLIAGLVAVAGMLAVLGDDRGHVVRLLPIEWIALVVGSSGILYAFMADALVALPADSETLTQLRPTNFKWPVYLAGLALMGYALWQAMWPRRVGR